MAKKRGRSTKTSKSPTRKRKSVRNLDPRKSDSIKGGWTKGGGAAVG